MTAKSSAACFIHHLSGDDQSPAFSRRFTVPTPHLTMGRFRTYEIAPVAEDNGACEAHASMEDARLQSECTFWSLYGVAPSREVTWIGDYRDYASAAEMYTLITGCIAPANPDALRLLDLPAGP
jgi:hypothetical protein